MADPVTWQTVAQAVLPGAIGGFIGAGSALYGAAKAGERDLLARREQSRQDREQRREDSLMSALRMLVSTHTSTLSPAIDVRNLKVAGAPEDEITAAEQVFHVAHMAAVVAQEEARITARSEAVLAAVEALRKHEELVYDYSRMHPPPGFETGQASKTMRSLLRDATTAIQAECDALWT